MVGTLKTPQDMILARFSKSLRFTSSKISPNLTGSRLMFLKISNLVMQCVELSLVGFLPLDYIGMILGTGSGMEITSQAASRAKVVIGEPTGRLWLSTRTASHFVSCSNYKRK